MSDERKRPLNDAELDALLEQSLPELPGEDMVRDVTPWRRAMNRVLTGFALNALTLNFLGLNYLLPTIGIFLLLLGFRSLRRENRAFGLCWGLTVLRAVINFALLVLQGSIWHQRFADSVYGDAVLVVSQTVIFANCFCLWLGIRAVQKKTGLPPRAPTALGLMIWDAMLIILYQFTGRVGWLAAFFIVGSYLLLIYFLVLLSRELDEAGYAVQLPHVRLSDRALVLILLCVLLLGLACAYLFFNSYPMDWQPVEETDKVQVRQVKEELLALGFPEEVLNDLTDGDILACEGAEQVLSNTVLHPVESRLMDMVYDSCHLSITGVGVKLPGERERWKIIHYFLWLEDPGFYGTESIQLWPAYRLHEGWGAAGEGFSGRVLCEQNGSVYAAPYYSLKEISYVSESVFFGTQQNNDVFATFSFPSNSSAQRGYISYAIEKTQEHDIIVDAWINYTHQQRWFQYPVLSAMEYRMAGGWGSDGPFKTVQDALQLYDGKIV